MRSIKKNPLKLLRVFVFVLLFVFCSEIFNTSNTVYSALAFGNTQFQDVWRYSDLSVASGSEIERGYTWGPNSLGVIQEVYQDAPGGTRQVQYFDKSRMELQLDPDTTYVTNGLLTKELVTGRIQEGEAVYTQYAPSQTQIAGDPNNQGGNPIAPTYSSFLGVTTFIPGLHSAVDQTGKIANLSIDKAGKVTTLETPPMAIALGAFEVATGHNVPKIFVDFQNQQGRIWDGKRFVKDKVYTNNPTANVFGYPVSEPYWIKVNVKGERQDVLVQLFERRVLTFTPANPDPYKVEMGNIGQHYFNWRYNVIHYNTTHANSPGVTFNKESCTLTNPGNITNSVISNKLSFDQINQVSQTASSIDSSGKCTTVFLHKLW